MWIILIVALSDTVIVGPALGLTLKDLYPFGDQAGDDALSKNDDGSSPPIPILTLFPFFNHQHSKLFVSRLFHVDHCFICIKDLNHVHVYSTIRRRPTFE